MITLGRKNQVNCTENDFYEFLGYVANHPNDVKIVWEHNENQGAWGSEGRIQFFSSTRIGYFQAKGFYFTAGVGNIIARLNCNELIDEMRMLGFLMGSQQNCQVIRTNIPASYHNAFDRGVNL